MCMFVNAPTIQEKKQEFIVKHKYKNGKNLHYISHRAKIVKESRGIRTIVTNLHQNAGLATTQYTFDTK